MNATKVLAFLLVILPPGTSLLFLICLARMPLWRNVGRPDSQITAYSLILAVWYKGVVSWGWHLCCFQAFNLFSSWKAQLTMALMEVKPRGSEWLTLRCHSSDWDRKVVSKELDCKCKIVISDIQFTYQENPTISSWWKGKQMVVWLSFTLTCSYLETETKS